MNKESDRLKGTISLYFDGELIASRRFLNPYFRKIIVEEWEKIYQIKKQDKRVYYQVIYD